MKTSKKINDFNLMKYRKSLEEIEEWMIKTIEVTGLEKKQIKKLLENYTHSEIRLRYKKQ